MILLIVLALLVVFVLAPATSYGGYYPATWGPSFGWLPAVLLVLLLIWLLTGGRLA